MPSPPDPAALERPWLAAYPPGVPPTYDLPKVPLGRFLDDAARDFGDRDALVTPDGGTIDHVTLRDRVEATATVLGELGIEAGERVLVALPNHETTPTVLFAVWRLGAVVVPVPPGLPVDRLAPIAADAGLAAVVAVADVLDAMAGQDVLPPLAVVVDGREWRPRRRLDRLRRRRRAPDPGEGRVALGERLGELDGRRSVPSGPLPDDPAVLAYRPEADEPRGAVLSHANLVANAFQARLWIPDVQAGKERVLVADPLHDLAAMTCGLLTGALAAATVLLVDEPDAGDLATMIDREGPTLLVGGPERMTELATGAPSRRDLGSLRVCLSVGGPLDPEVAADLEQRTAGARVRECFGLREASPLTHAQPVYGRAEPESMGLPVTDTVAVVVDPQDPSAVCPPDEPGLLLVSGPQVAAGYWRRPEETAAAFVDGWLVTGDLVTASADGVFHHVGRADEVVRRDHTLVAPRRIETVLERHPDVERAGVVVLDGPALVAAVGRRRRHRVAVDDLMAHCRVHLDAAAVPDRIEVVDEVPVTTTGRVARDELRRQLIGR